MSKKGFSLIEVLLALSIFALVSSAVAMGIVYSKQSFYSAGNRIRAAFLAEEGLEAVRNIRDADFAGLSGGSYGLSRAGGQWSLVPGSDTTDSFFTRQIVISETDTNRRLITVNVNWPRISQGNSTISVATRLTNWHRQAGPPAPGTCSAYCVGLGGYTAGTCRANANACSNNSEVYESGGDASCTGGPSQDTCCCVL